MKRAPRGGIWVNGRFYRGGQFLPKQSPAIPEDVAIHAAIALMPTSTEAAQAMHRYLRGRPTRLDMAVLDGRRLKAIETLRESSTTEKEWLRWNDRYVATAQGVQRFTYPPTSLAGA